MPHSVLTITQILALLAADYDLKTEMKWNDKKIYKTRKQLSVNLRNKMCLAEYIHASLSLRLQVPHVLDLGLYLVKS